MMCFLKNFVAVVAVFVSVHAAVAQEVVASYADPAGTVIRFRASDGSEIARIQQVYKVGYSPFYPTRIALESPDFYYEIFGNRYLARVRASDGAIVWVVDASIMIAYVRYPVLDLAVAGGNVFVCTNDPAGRIMKYRASDGALLWTITAGVQSGYVLYTPIRVAAVGTDVYVALGGMFLTRLSASNGAVIWRKSIPLTYSLTTWGVADITVSGGFIYVANVDPNGTLRKFNASDGTLIWTKNPTYLLNGVKYLPTLLAANGRDSVMTLFGFRYLSLRSAADASGAFTKDVGLRSGAIIYAPTDLAAIPSP